MAKVYDALRRAEAERKRRAEPAADPAVVRLDWEPELPASDALPAPVEGDSFLRRLLAWGARDDIAADINKRRIALLQPDSFVAEQFRALRGRIDAMAAKRPIRSVAVTSAMPGEGKTTAAVNLAIVTALSLDRSVLLIDCDLRKPKVHQALGLRPQAGLAEVLSGDVGLDEALLKVEGTSLEVLAVRGRPANPSELLASSRMRELVEQATKRYDRVILDTPAALGLPDAKIVADLCDGAVMVVRADFTSQEDAQTVLEILDRSRVLGLLLNGAEVRQGRYGYVS
ncbi:MAG: CpsD/CapB family tyrosine-protein kinase [Myxococcales bacterium]|nr:CpsD/CapB family tyrosine-protein kinase [Myxococcales bacterium]